MKVLVKLLLTLPFACLIGCGEPDWQAGIDEYHKRISRVLDIDYRAISWQVEPLYFPSRRDLRLAEPELSIGMLDFLKISQCDLQRLIGENNSALAKVQSASQRLFYHLTFIELAESCVASGGVEGELRTVLTSAIAAKKEAIPIYISNAFIGSQEVQGLFRPFGEVSPAQMTQVPAMLEQALEVVAGVHRGALEARVQQDQSKVYEQALLIIGASQYAGVLVHQHQQLLSALLQMKVQLVERDFCVVAGNGAALLSSTKRDALLFILREHYIASVQQTAAYLVRQRKQWFALWQVAQSGSAPVPELTNYWQQVDKLYEQFDELLLWHTQYWQQRLERCQIGLQN